MFFHTKSKLTRLCAHIWSASLDFSDKAGIKDDLTFDVAVCASYIYCIQDILHKNNIKDKLLSCFSESSCKLIAGKSFNPFVKRMISDILSFSLNLYSKLSPNISADHDFSSLIDIILLHFSPNESMEDTLLIPDHELLVTYITGLTTITKYLVTTFPKK